MTLVSNAFWLFVAAVVAIYYLVPAKTQWLVLLVFSYAYYMAGGVRYLFFLIFSTLVTWGFALAIDLMREKGKPQKILYTLVALGLIFNFAMLGYVKYANFFLGNINALFRVHVPLVKVIFPLGISFYTFQSSGYLLDVYWKKIPAQRNVLRYALFVSFFPQLLQGPIAKYSKLADQLYASHSFALHHITRGIQRILWGLAKKMILADWAGVFVDAIKSDPDTYAGALGLGMILWYINLYMDFSGAIDVAIGIGNLFGIDMEENFQRPYLSASLAGFWKRWHITLGEWMMAYVFYPVSLTAPAHALNRWGKKHFSRKLGRSLQVAYAELVVFFVVGIWHGADWMSISYGLFNGLVIAVSEVMKPYYAAWKKALHVTGEEKGYRLFMILRTNFLFWVQAIFEFAVTLPGAVKILLVSFTTFRPALLLQIPAGRGGVAFAPYALAIVIVGTTLVIAIGCIQERIAGRRSVQEEGVGMRASLAKLPLPLTTALYLILFLCIGLFGCTAATKGFIYAQF